MNKELVRAQDVFLEKINEICGKFGLNNIMAQLYAVLYLSNKPLSLGELAERLHISKASASVNMRALERYGVVKSVWVKGSRRDYYRAEADIANVIITRAKSMAQGRLSELEDIINSSSQVLKDSNPPAVSEEEKEELKVFKERVEALRDFHKKAQAVFDLLNSRLVKGMLNFNAKRKS